MDYSHLLSELLEDWQAGLKTHKTRCSDLLETFTKLRGQYLLGRRKEGHGFNQLDYFYIGEKEHSGILADLLNPWGTHGHETLFLQAFLNLIKIPGICESEDWEVTPEIGRIDILLKRRRPHSVIVMENKSNNARDQEHQLYRYWYQEIYWPMRNSRNPDYKDKETYLLPEVSQRYKVIYLATADWKRPVDLSLTKPDWDDLTSFPDIMPIGYEVWIFKDFIRSWLEACLPAIDLQNSRLRGFIQSYIDHWDK